MTPAVTDHTGRLWTHHRLLAATFGLLLIDVLVVVLGRSFPAVQRGWLLAFAILSPVPIGGMVLLMIHALTGGAWGIAAGPILRRAAALMPFAAIAFLPVLTGLAEIYPWASDRTIVAPDVAHWYLNSGPFALRSAVALIVWSGLGLVFGMGLRSQLIAALGLAFFGLSVSFLAVDWYLSLAPHYTSSAFAAMIAVQDMLVTLAVVAAIGRFDRGVSNDIAALLIALLLGVVYLEFMAFVIAWYGDLPAKSAWYLKRASAGWIEISAIDIIIGALLPLCLLASGHGLRSSARLILGGATLHTIWLLAPEWTSPLSISVIAAVLAVVLVTMGLLGSTALRPLADPEVAHVE